MARPIKQGLDYFPFDVSFFEDRGIRAVKRRYGMDGLMIYIYTLTAIYRDRGYYIMYDDDFRDDIGESLNMDDNKLQQVINFLCERSLFDNKLFVSDKVLTSHGIQLRYQQAKAETGKTRVIEVDERLWVLKENETESFIKLAHFEGFSPKNDSFSGKNHSFPQEKPLNKRKEKESKEKKNKQPAGAADVRSFDPFIIAVKRGWRIERELTATEENAVAVWRQELGMSAEMIVEAGDICIRNTGKIVIAYINAVLMRWKTEGVFTVDELHRKGNASAPHSIDTGGVYEDSIDHDELEKLVWSNLGG